MQSTKTERGRQPQLIGEMRYQITTHAPNLVLENYDVLQTHDLHCGQVLACLRLRTSLVTSHQQKGGVHDLHKARRSKVRRKHYYSPNTINTHDTEHVMKSTQKHRTRYRSRGYNTWTWGIVERIVVRIHTVPGEKILR